MKVSTRLILPALALLGFAAGSTALAATPAAPAKAALATADGETAGTRLEVTQISRTGGDTVTLKFTLINDGTAALDTYPLLVAEHGKTGSVDGLDLVDPAAKKSYHVIRDARGGCLCSQNLAAVAPGARINLWAKFPAPAVGVKTVSVVAPHFSPIDDLKLEP